MKTELLGQEKNVVRIKVDFEAEEFSSNLNETIQEIAQKTNIPGFRKGHTPRRVIEMRFGRENLYGEAFQKLISNAVEQVVGDYDLDTIAAPSLSMEDTIQEGKPLSCELTFEVTPEVALPELGEIEVEKLIPKVTDEMVDVMVQNLRREHSVLSPATRPAQEKDVLSVKYVTEVSGPEGEPVKSDEQKGDVDLAESTIRPDVRNALLGKSAGETAEVEFNVEEAHEDKTVAGKKVHYFFTVEEVKERVLPEMAPEFYKKALGTDIESEEAFREELKKRLLARIDADNTSQATMTAVDRIVEKSSLEVPETLVKRQIEFQKERDAADAKKRYGQELSEVLKNNSVNPEDYERNLRATAENIVRRSLVLDEIGKKFDVEVQKTELDGEIDRRAELYGVEPTKLRAIFYKNRETVGRVVEDIRYGKITKIIMENVKVRDVEQLSPASSPNAPEAESAQEQQ
ncbi:MAG: trigger factor [Synergistaceae bacterium]|jgi:trigger factor|nr:trigger factor [Synergistaceae bacterium]